MITYRIFIHRNVFSFFSTVALALCAFGIFSFAHAGAGGTCHFHGSKEAGPELLADCATKRIAQLIEAKKIPASWKDAKQEKIEQIVGKNQKKEWMVTFKNPKETQKSQETLFIFFSLQGNFIAANFTGR